MGRGWKSWVWVWVKVVGVGVGKSRGCLKIKIKVAYISICDLQFNDDGKKSFARQDKKTLCYWQKNNTWYMALKPASNTPD